MTKTKRSGMVVDIIRRNVFPGTVHIDNGIVIGIERDIEPKDSVYILPGFIDAHIHIESSMLIPSEFARLATVHGTVATVSDPHEIANVLGIEGIRYMIANGKRVPFHFFFGASSCVPATAFETAGARIDGEGIETLFTADSLKYLSEVMNFPGVIHNDPEVMKKLKVARLLGKPIDGHAPGLRGEDLKKYVSAGISTDHECFEFEEALEKVKLGMHILIREGSAAKNYEALHPLIAMFPEKVMFCCDDKHPHELVEGHINQFVKRSIVDKGYDLFDVLRAASFNPVQHYHLEVGLLQENDPADFIVVNNLHDFQVLETYVKGELVAKNGKTLITSVEEQAPNHFHCALKKPDDFKVASTGEKIRVIQAEDGQLITHQKIVKANIVDGYAVSSPERNLLKIAVVNRYQEAKPAIAFIANFGLKQGAIASCIAHDSHNIIVVGCTDEEICEAVNLIIKHKGGIAIVDGEETHVLPLPVAGIMTNEEGYKTAEQYAKMDKRAKQLGTHLSAPFMTLSFMALLVIPELKLSDKGLFDAKKFAFTKLNA